MKKERNAELLSKLDEYLEAIDPQDLFEELEGRYADGPTLESVFASERHWWNDCQHFEEASDLFSQAQKPSGACVARSLRLLQGLEVTVAHDSDLALAA